MKISKALLDILVCPKCKGEIRSTDEGLLCEKCQLLYPIRDGVPVMLIDVARRLENGDKGKV